MNLVALMPARNEAWILGASARATLMWCDSIIALDHASTDETPDILREVATEHPGRVTILEDPNPEWREMQHRQRLLEAARKNGATHLAIVDADEVLSGNLLPIIREQVECLPMGSLWQIPMRNIWGSLTQYRRDASCWGSAVTTIAFADRHDLCWRASGGYQHHHREPYNSRVSLRIYPHQMDGGVMHLQFANRRRLVAKHALYKMDEVRRWPGWRRIQTIDQEYSMAPDWSSVGYAPVPESWWAQYRHLMRYLDLDREPWQELACKRLMIEHGAAAFRGLDLFGVA